MFWVISVYFNVRNILPKSGTFPRDTLYIYITNIVDNSKRYFVARQKCKGNPLLLLCDKTNTFILLKALSCSTMQKRYSFFSKGALWKWFLYFRQWNLRLSNTQRKKCWFPMATMVKRRRHSVALYVRVYCLSCSRLPAVTVRRIICVNWPIYVLRTLLAFQTCFLLCILI